MRLLTYELKLMNYTYCRENQRMAEIYRWVKRCRNYIDAVLYTNDVRVTLIMLKLIKYTSVEYERSMLIIC